MPAAFIIFSSPPARVGVALTRLGLSPSRVETIFWGGRQAPRLGDRAIPTVQLAAGYLSGILALHSAAQAVLARGAEVALAGSGGEAILLASAEAVGRLNLAPRAEVSSFGLDLTPAEALRRALKRLDLPEGQVECFVFARVAPAQTATINAAPGQITYQERPRVAPLIKTLERQKRSYGAWIAATPSLACATVLERV